MNRPRGWIFSLIMLTIVLIPAMKVNAGDYEITSLYKVMGEGYYDNAMYWYFGDEGQTKIVTKDKKIFFVTTEWGQDAYRQHWHVYLHKSLDGGRTFEPRLRVDTLLNAWAPSIVLDGSGNIYIVYSGFDNSFGLGTPGWKDGNVYMSKSLDDGQTFTHSILVNNRPGMTYTGYWSPIVRIAANNTIYVAWDGPGVYYSSSNINLAKSTDGGQSFEVRTIFNSTDPNPDTGGYGKEGPNLEIGKNGEIYLAWFKYPEQKAIFARSEDGGNTFSSTVLDSMANRRGRPKITVDKIGNIYVVWSHSLCNAPCYSSVVYFAKSEDNGKSFSRAVEVAPNLSGDGVLLMYPDIAIDEYGRIYVSLSEYKTHGTLYLTRSDDGGSSFDPVITPISGGAIKSSVFDDENNLYIWAIDQYSLYVTKIIPKDTIQPALAVSAVDAPCDNGGSISLNWTLSQDDPAVGTGSNKVTGYNVYRSETSGGPYSVSWPIPGGIGNFTDNRATDGTKYYYIVRATDGTKESVDSNEASATSSRNLPLLPTNLTAADTPYDLGGSMTLSWTKSADDGGGLNNVVSYNISRYSSTNGNITTIAYLPAGNSGYVDNTTSDNETYFYYVKAYDKNCSNGSGASNIAEGRSINNFTALPGYISTLPGISSQLLNSLTSKVENAISSFESGNTTAAVNKLNALLNEISAQSGKGIEPSTAQILANYVQNLITYINAH